MRHFRRGVHKIILFALLGLVYFSAAAKYSGGNGTADDPYQIGTAADLIALANDQTDWNGKYFELAADIDMAGQTFTPIGSTLNVFSGTFDGQKNNISNLTVTPVLVNGLAQKGTGLFGSFSGSLTNLGIININIDVSSYQNSSRVGALAGELAGGIISNCFSDGGTINSGGGGWTGGLVGALWEGGNKTVEDCYSTTTVTAGWRNGGVVGVNRGAHSINRVAFYGTVTKGEAIVQVHTEKGGIAPTNAVYKQADGLSDVYATALNTNELLESASYPTFDFETVWGISETAGYAILGDTIIVPELSFFEKIKVQRVESDTSVVWKNFGPGMSGYNEEFWCHPTDTNVMFMGPDMHVSYGTWDNGKSWHSLKDFDGDGQDLERVNDMAFSMMNPDFGVAIDRDGLVNVTSDRGKNWEVIYKIPHAAENQWTNAHSRVAIDPKNDSIWYVGAGGFWDVKSTHRSKANPHGTGNTTYAHGYILKTTDKGKTWKKIATGIDSKLNVGKILIHPDEPNRIVLAAGQGMFLSTDAGETWNPSNTGLPNNLPKDLASYYNPDTKEYILYTMEQSVYEQYGNSIQTKGGVYKSIDGGATWTNMTGDLGLDFTVITDYSFRDKYANTVGFWLGKSKNDIKALNYPSQTLQVFRRIAVNPKNKNEVYLFPNQRHDKNFGPGDLWKTNDGGQTWKIVTKHGTYWRNNTNSSYWAGKGMTMAPNVEFAHVRYSNAESHESGIANRHLAMNANGHVFIGIGQQTHRSKDGGKSWQQIDDDETGDGTNAWVGRGDSDLPGRFMLHNTGIPDRKLFCSGEHGLWQSAELGEYPDKDAMAVRQIQGQVNDINGNHDAHSVSTVAVHPKNPNTIFILAWRQSHRGWLRKTTDGGQTWNNVVQIFDADNASHEAVASQYSLLIDPVNPENMYFTAILKPISCGTNSGPGVDLTMGEYGAHRSSDGGNTWEVINNGFPSGASVNRLVMDPDNPEVLYAALNQWRNDDPYGLYKTTNKGNSWTKMTIPSQIRSVNNLYIDKKTKYMYMSCGSRAGADEAGGLYRSEDNGENWDLFFEAPYVWHAETSPVNSNKIMVNVARKAGDYGLTFKNPGFYLSQDDGETWTKINKGIGQPDKMVDIELDPYNENILWAAGWGSGWFKAMISYDGVKAVCDDAEVKEKEELTLYGIGSLGSQLEYMWIAPEGISLSSDNQYKTTFTAPEVDSDTVVVFKLIVSNNEATDTTNVNVKVINTINTAVPTVSKNEIQVYPNPVDGNYLNVVGAEQKSNFEIFDLKGQMFLNGILNSETVDVSGLQRGIYLFRIRQNEGSIVKKIIRQ